MRFWNKSLIARLVTYFLALSVIGVIATMLITLAIVRSLLTSSIYDRLNAVATLKENEINRWVNDQRDELSYLAVKPDLRVHVRTLSAAEEDPAKYAAAHDAILEILTRAAESHPSFSEVFLMSSVGGKVLVSTEKGNEGQYRVSDSYYTQGRLDSYIQNVYISPQTGQPTMTISAPVRDADGKLLGVLATHINLDRLDSIILQRAGLGKSGETYIVDRFNNFISVARFGERGFPRGVHTQGIDAALRGVNGAAMYKNYNGIPVIGVYRWVEEREIALLAEINQSEALAPVQRVAALIILSGFTIVVLLTLGIFRLARQIAHPLLAINNAANQMATGDLEARAPVLTEDEIGTLAAAFNTMAGQIKQLVSGLEQRVAERTVELEIANKHNAERAVRLKTIAEVNRAISSIRELKPL
ncbi:MAG: cache domain-containing protein, partial [Candidatus Villigracilaceae bacterium]